jgi:two-component system sensor histidine kinase PilS (NtrC family)
MRPAHAVVLDEIERRRSRLNLTLLRVYAGYGAAAALVLIAAFQQTFTPTRLGTLDPGIFMRVAVVAALVDLTLVLLLARIGWFARHLRRVVLTLAVWDVLVVAALLYASGGVGSGLGALLLVSVAITAMLLAGNAGLVLPAIATLVLFYEEFYLGLTAPHLRADYFHAAVLGGLFFATALTIRFLSRRIRENDLSSLTQAAELAELEQLNRQIIQRMRTGVAVVDPIGRLRTLNDAALELLDMDAADLPDRLPESVGQHLRAWRRVTDHRARPFQATPESAEVRVSFSPVRPGEPGGDVIVFVEDTAELQQQALQLKLASLGQLSASIAHEIRNPLSAISHAAQLLHESSDLCQGDRRLAEIIHSHCQRMNGVIENVLTTSRRQAPQPVRMALAEELDKVATTFRETLPDAEIETTVEPASLEVQMDRSQLDQVLTNLMQNAVRHSRARSGRPWVRLCAGLDARSGRPYVDVSDEGDGVDEARARRLFEPFFTTERGGTGLGLYLSRELCEANQARLSLRQSAAAGACFRITFAHPDRVIA